MLSDPIAVTYNTVGKNLARISGLSTAGAVRTLSSGAYSTADGEFTGSTRSSQLKDGSKRVEFILTRTTPDNDADPFTGSGARLPNSFGVVYVVNSLHYASSVDIPRLRAALLAFLDTATELRVMNGEL